MVNADNVIRAFSADHVVKLTSLSHRQLSYWDKTGFFSPRHAAEDRRLPYSRIYSFRDLVGLKAIALLRKDHGVPLQRLREVAAELSRREGASWSETRFFVLDKRVHFEEPETGGVREAVSGQYVIIPLVEIVSDVSREAEALRKRAPGQCGEVERHRYVARNAWVVAGTRIPTGAIRRFVEAGYTVNQILREYPSLTRDDVTAALAQEEELAQTA